MNIFDSLDEMFWKSDSIPYICLGVDDSFVMTRQCFSQSGLSPQADV